MLDSWLQWAPGDDRGSRDYATVRSLSTAVDKALANWAVDITEIFSPTYDQHDINDDNGLTTAH